MTAKAASRSPAAQHFVFLTLAAAYVEAGRLEDAETAMKQARAKEPDLSVSYLKKSQGNLKSEKGMGELLEQLRIAGLPQE
jgi:predicted Zn-dependent protease